MKVVLVANVDNLKNLGPTEHWRIQFVAPTVGAKPGNASGNENTTVNYVSGDNVPAHSFDHILAFRGAHLIDDHIEAHKVDVVWQEVHDEESKDVFGSDLPSVEATQKDDVQTEEDSYEVKFTELLFPWNYCDNKQNWK